MAKLVVEGRDKLLEALGFRIGIKKVRLSQSEVETLELAASILEKASSLWYEAKGLDEDSISDNPYAVAEIEVRCAIEEQYKIWQVSR